MTIDCCVGVVKPASACQEPLSVRQVLAVSARLCLLCRCWLSTCFLLVYSRIIRSDHIASVNKKKLSLIGSSCRSWTRCIKSSVVWETVNMAATSRLNRELKAKMAKAKTTATDPVEKLRACCLERGASGIKGLGRYAIWFYGGRLRCGYNTDMYV